MTIKAERREEALGLVVQIAIDHSMTLLEVEEKVYEAFKKGEKTFPYPYPSLGMPDFDVVEMVIGPSGLSDKAQTWLNENAVPEGWRFQWWNGLFTLLSRGGLGGISARLRLGDATELVDRRMSGRPSQRPARASGCRSPERTISASVRPL